jgi:uncharacterized membrane protein YoaK (UPF0700 family)
VTRDPLPHTLLALTFATGVVDAAAFLGLDHVFAANQTGNVVFLAFALAGAGGLSARAALVSLLAFVLGATLGGLYSPGRGARRGWAIAAFLVEAGLCLAAALAAIDLGSSDLRRDVVVAFLALAMGMRNATVRRLGVTEFSTVVLTTTLTGLFSDLPRAPRDGGVTARRAGSVAAMFVGALAGAALVVRGHLLVALILVSGTVLLAAGAYAALSAPRTLEERA